jgi:glycosyltransferase involved in cell wall biosynthesis
VRTLFVTNMYPTQLRPDFGIIVRRLAEAITEQGVDVQVLPISGGRGRFDYFTSRGRVREEVRRLRPDVVHVHFGYSILATTRNYPRVVSFYGDDLNGESTGRQAAITLKSRLGQLVSEMAAASADRSIAVSDSLRQRIKSEPARQRCEVIRDAVDTRLFKPIPQHLARERLGVCHSRSLILFPHSPLQRTKRLDLAQAAVTRLCDHGPSAELWTVNGRPPDEMPLYYAAADALIVTSDLEGGPSCVKEALACGLPVVSVPVGDQQVLNDAHGMCFLAERNPDDLAGALQAALRLRECPRANRLPRDLVLSNSAQRVIELYHDAIERYRGHAGVGRA